MHNPAKTYSRRKYFAAFESIASRIRSPAMVVFSFGVCPNKYPNALHPRQNKRMSIASCIGLGLPAGGSVA